MSLYREARSGRRRLWLAVGAGAAVVAIVAVVAVLATTGGSQTDTQKLESLQEDVQPALAALELIPLHYASPNPTTHALRRPTSWTSRARRSRRWRTSFTPASRS